MSDSSTVGGDTETLCVLPVQVIEVRDGVVLSRGGSQVRLTGIGVFDVLEEVLSRLQPPGMSRVDLVALFAGPDRGKLNDLLDLLIARRLVVSDGAADPADADRAEVVFFWDFGLKATDIRARFNEQRIHIAGINRVGLALARALSESGFTDLTLIDTPMLRNLSLYDDTGTLRPDDLGVNMPTPVEEAAWRATAVGHGRPTLLVGTSDFGGKTLLRRWNEYAVGHGVSFFPVVLQHMVGSIGPVIVPYETPCYECVRGRENSNMDDPETQRELEAAAFEGQFSAGYHPLMPRLVADQAAFELTKVYSGIDTRPTGRLITISPLSNALSVHRVLRLPYCPVCGVDARHARPALAADAAV